MTESLDMLPTVVDFMRRQLGLMPLSTGVAGSMWADSERTIELVVPSRLLEGSAALEGVLARLAPLAGQPVELLRDSLKLRNYDVTRLVAENSALIHDSISLTAGFQLVATARDSIRAVATTSMSLKGHIAGGFSKRGDELVSKVRMALTEPGSYVLPIWVPVHVAPDSRESTSPFDPSVVSGIPSEPSERRMTRMLAQSLLAVERNIVEPAKAPTVESLHPVVSAGGSRELVSALEKLVLQPTVAGVRAEFSWSPQLPAPGGVASSVHIPAEAAELLTQATRLMRTSRRDLSQTVTGPIVDIFRIPDDPFGEIAVQTVRGGRPAMVRVRLRADQLDDAHRWMSEVQSVVVEGNVERIPGQPLRIVDPSRFLSLESTMFPVDPG